MHDGDFRNLLIPTSEIVLVICNETFVGCFISAGNRNDLGSFPSSVLGDVQATIKTGNNPNDIAGAVVGVMKINSIFVVIEVVNLANAELEIPSFNAVQVLGSTSRSIPTCAPIMLNRPGSETFFFLVWVPKGNRFKTNYCKEPGC